MKILILFSIIVIYTHQTFSAENTLLELMDSINYYQHIQDFEHALELSLKAEPLVKAEYGEKDKNYIEIMTTIYVLYYYLGYYDNSLEYCSKTKSLIEELNGVDSQDYAEAAGNLGYLYNSIGKIAQAEPLYIEALGLRRKLHTGDHPELAISISNMAVFYNNKGEYEQAEPLYKEALEMRRRLFDGDHPDLATSLNNVAFFYQHRGELKLAEPFFKEALEMSRRLFDGDHPDLAQSIDNMGVFYNTRGDYGSALPLLTEALEMFKRLYKGDHLNLAVSLNNLGNFYFNNGEIVRAESLFNEALEMLRRLFKGDHPNLVISIGNMADFYELKGDFEKAEALYKESLEMSKRLFTGYHPHIAKCISSLAIFYDYMGIDELAEPMFKEALQIYRNLFRSDNYSLATSIFNLASYYNTRNNQEKAEPLYKEALDIYRNMLNKYFPSLSENEKKLFWKTVSYHFESFNTFAVKRAQKNPRILGDIYDLQLFTKSMLLNSTNRIKKRILSSGDSTMIAMYKSLVQKRELLVNLYKMTLEELNENNININAIENESNELEKQISLKSELFKESYEMKNISWKSIQALLKPDEAAVEVIRFKLHKNRRLTDSVYYAFLIVNGKTENYPELVLIDYGDKLENKYYGKYREYIKNRKQDDFSFERFWSMLYEKTKDYKKIYFSGDGIYNKINPSTLRMPSGDYLIDHQDIQQINSTKDIIIGYYHTRKESIIYNSAVLIGNPNFSLSEDELRQIRKKFDNDTGSSNQELRAARNVPLTKLPGTEKEVIEIEQYLKSLKWDVSTFLGDMAVKSAVKSVNNPRVLHIATHGLFMEDVERDGRVIFGFDEQKMIENPLLRSGLFFTGADNFVKYKAVDELTDDENGILTAYEAMNLNLDRTELVVLSACETGLGDIINGEGVFGLRRAFQAAGAKTVVMSLWNVSDQATQMLMSEFYRNWITGMTKRNAFIKAQLTTRMKYPAPYYWGAFVMVGE